MRTSVRRSGERRRCPGALWAMGTVWQAGSCSLLQENAVFLQMSSFVMASGTPLGFKTVLPQRMTISQVSRMAWRSSSKTMSLFPFSWRAFSRNFRMPVSFPSDSRFSSASMKVRKGRGEGHGDKGETGVGAEGCRGVAGRPLHEPALLCLPEETVFSRAPLVIGIIGFKGGIDGRVRENNEGVCGGVVLCTGVMKDNHCVEGVRDEVAMVLVAAAAPVSIGPCRRETF
jgi:hypothetical protein